MRNSCKKVEEWESGWDGNILVMQELRERIGETSNVIRLEKVAERVRDRDSMNKKGNYTIYVDVLSG